VGGSEQFHGAPVLASVAANNTLAALRIGAGYSITCVPKSVVLAVREVSPNLIVRALGGENLGPDDLKILEDVSNRAQAVVIGPGLGKSSSTLYTIRKFVEYAISADKRVVIDADALYAIAGIAKLGKNVLITPNMTEFRIFYETELDYDDAKSRIGAAMEVARRLDTNVLLKGHETIITDGKRYKIVRAKTPALATMGTGDVLAGIIGGFAARNDDMFSAAVAGAYAHSLIGDVLYKDKGNHIIATDVVEAIPKALKGIA
jgi:NAD(P)H-hydrate epimerase